MSSRPRDSGRRRCVSSPSVSRWAIRRSTTISPAKEKLLYGYCEHVQRRVMVALKAVETFHEYSLAEQLRQLVESELQTWLPAGEFLQEVFRLTFNSPAAAYEHLQEARGDYVTMVVDMLDAAIVAAGAGCREPGGLSATLGPRLRGGAEFPTGGRPGSIGRARERLRFRRVSRSGAKPGPTVTVRMKGDADIRAICQETGVRQRMSACARERFFANLSLARSVSCF